MQHGIDDHRIDDGGIDDDLAPTEALEQGREPRAAAAPEAALPPGTLVGRYRIEAMLGQGGMGEVYLAEQLEPVRRRVALKLLRDRRVDARHLAWFELERQLLAQMQHPAIAQIFDAGATHEGQPYFAMEYIEGPPITRYCDEHGLALTARIELLARVCDGVQHAHGRGVVHRDLKPGNVLVTDVDGRAQPKIIDFGIATAASRYSDGEDAGRAGTPAYMSPEQAGIVHADIDPRSDVYSLGVMLCELLTGARPPVPAGSGEDTGTTLRPPSAVLAARGERELASVADSRGVTPARLLTSLRHELDWVVLRAIRPEPAQRYSSAAELAQELRRFLGHRPVLAVPSGSRYLLAKFVRRHRLGVAAGAVVALALVVGLALSLWGLLEANAQRSIAEARQQELEQVAAFQQSMLEDIDVAAMGQGVLQLQRDQLARLEDGGAALAAFEQVAQRISEADVARGVLDQYVLAQALQALERDFADQPQIAADVQKAIAHVYYAIGLYPQSEAAARAAVETRSRLYGAADGRTLAAQDTLAIALHRQGRLDDARAVLEAALPLARAGGAAAMQPRWALTQTRALVHSDQGELQQAAELQQGLLDEMLPALGAEHERALSVRTNLAISLVRLGRPEESRREFEEVYRVRGELLGPEHPDTVSAMHNVAAILGTTGDYAGALELQRRSLDLHRRTLGAEHPMTLSDLNNVASTLSNMGELDEALARFEEAAQGARRVLGPEHPLTLRAIQNQAAVLNRLGRAAEALPLQREALEARERTLGAEHPNTLASRDTFAHILRDLGRFDEARREAERTLEARRRVLGEQHPDVAKSVFALASVEGDAGNTAVARGLLEALLERQRASPGVEHGDTLFTAARLYRLRVATGDADGAVALRAELLDPLVARNTESLDGGQRNARREAVEAIEAVGPIEERTAR